MLSNVTARSNAKPPWVKQLPYGAIRANQPSMAAGAMLAAYYALQVVAPALALRKAFKLSTLEALIGSLTLVRVAWMMATR